MGFARLHFPNSGTVLMTHVLYDVVGVLTGTFTSASQLQTATITLSTVVNTANSNWSFVYPASHGTKGTTNTSWVLSAPTLSGGKTKYIRLTNLCNSTINGGAGTTLYYDSALGNSNSQGGLIMQSATAAASAISITNGTHINLNSGTASTSFAGNYIYLSWSARHCLIYGQLSSLLEKSFVASFEHQETGITTSRAVAPVLHLIYTSSAGSWNTTDTVPSAVANKNSIFLALNHFNVSTATASGLHNILSNINSQQNDMPLCSDAIPGAYSSVTTKNSSGALARFVQPLWVHQHHIGVPHLHVSHLANVYRTGIAMGSENDTVTIGADTFVYLPTENGTFNLLVRRA